MCDGPNILHSFQIYFRTESIIIGVPAMSLDCVIVHYFATTRTFVVLLATQYIMYVACIMETSKFGLLICQSNITIELMTKINIADFIGVTLTMGEFSIRDKSPYLKI